MHDGLPVTGSSAVPDDFERGLVESLQPIRQFTLAAALHHFFDQGIFDALVAAPSVPVPDLVERLTLDAHRLTGFLLYLQNEGIVALEGDSARLTAAGRALAPYRSWYTMLIGGYGGTFLELGACLRRGAPAARRNTAYVAAGSCGISHYDAIPLTLELIACMPTPCRRLLDLGCGNGLYLAEFCRRLPNLQACGVEPAADAYEEARRLVTAEGLEGRVVLYNATAQGFLESTSAEEPDVLVLGFVLHEILGQDGEAGVTRFLDRVRRRFPRTYLIVIEVDDRMTDATVMDRPLARSYYNAYYLLHYFTNQRLARTSFWESLFASSGFRVLEARTVDARVDSTGLEVGYLLRGADA